MNQNLVWGILVVALVGGLVAVGVLNNNSNKNITMDEETKEMVSEALNNPVVTVVTNQGTFELELFKREMPITAGNFLKLVEEGFYDGTRFHRVIPGFMVQGGDPLTKEQPANTAIHGTGGPGYMIEDEFVVGDKLSNRRGSISMANSGRPNSGGSQFFINVADNTFLDFDQPPLESKHPVFGQVVSGMEVVDKIVSVPTVPGDQPVEPVIIEKMTVK